MVMPKLSDRQFT